MNTQDFAKNYMATINGQQMLPQRVFREFLEWFQEKYSADMAEIGSSEASLSENVVKLVAISATAPVSCTEGQRYYNTVSDKIFTATGTDTWGEEGETPDSNVLYVLAGTEFKVYCYDGTMHLLSGLNGDEKYNSLDTYSKKIIDAINETNQTVCLLSYIASTDPSGENNVPQGAKWFNTNNNQIKTRVSNGWSSNVTYAVDGKLYVGPDSKLYVFDSEAGLDGELVLFTTKYGIAPAVEFEYDNGTLNLTIGGRTFALTATEVTANTEEQNG